MIYIFSKSAAYYKRIDVEGDFKRSGGGRSPANFIATAHLPNTSNVDNSGRRCPKSVISLGAKTLVKGGHPTEKPLDLYKFLIERYCPIDGTVLDPTFGSGNSVFCAYSLGLNSIGIEKDDTYFKKAEERLEAL
jgi:site-specific DNA-methyltransferase (adenine-specific)